MKTTATLLRERRRARDLTQEQLARMAGCDQTSISNIEVGRAQPSMRLAHRLALALECPLDDLIGGGAASHEVVAP